MARGKSTGGKEAPKKRRTCISTPRFGFIEECASQLGGEILKRFENSCFGHFKHLPRVMFCSHLVHNILQKRKDKEEEEEEDAISFIIGSQEICFGEREFAMMSGLKFQGTDEIVHKPNEEIRLMEAHFPGQKCVKLGELIEKFHQLKNNEDKLKLGLVAIVESAITGHDTRKNVNKGHFLLVDNLGEFNSYPWGKLFYKVTRDSLIKAKGKLAYNLNGFPHVFQAWIFESIPSLKQKYTVENKTCPQALNPRILHMEMAQTDKTKAPSHEQIRADLSCVDLEVLSTLHLTQEEVKESYMAGLLTEVDISGVRGHEKESGGQELRYEDYSTELWEANQCSSPMNSLIEVLSTLHLTPEEVKESCMPGLLSEDDISGVRGHDSGAEELRYEDNSTEQREVNHCSSPTNSLNIDKRIGTSTKECTALSNDEDQVVRSLENMKLNLRHEINLLNKEKSVAANDVGLLNKKREELETECCKLIEEKTVLNQEKLKLGKEIESLNMKKTKLGSDTYLLNKEKTKLQSDVELLKKEQATVQGDVCSLTERKAILETGIGSLSNEETNMRNEIELLSKKKTKLQSDFELLKKEQCTVQDDVCSLTERKAILETGIGSLSNEETNLRNEIELLSKKKTKLQSDFELLKKEMATVQALDEKKITLQVDIRWLSEKKTTLESKIEPLRNEKTNLRNDNQLLDKEKTRLQTEKTRLQTETEFFNKGKKELRSDFEFLDQEKAKLGKDVEKLKERKCEVEIDFGFLQNEKNKLHSDIESLNKEKAKLETDFELTNKEKDKLENDIECLNKEKDKLQSDIEYLNEEKAEFVRSVTADVNTSFYQREKILVANNEELQEARQELIKVMDSDKVTKNTVIGVKKRKRGDPELWNFTERKKATLKEVISFQLNRKR